MDYYGIDSPSSDFFMHYGVKGMKWGVRKKIDEILNKPRSQGYRHARQKLINKTNAQQPVYSNSGIRSTASQASKIAVQNKANKLNVGGIQKATVNSRTGQATLMQQKNNFASKQSSANQNNRKQVSEDLALKLKSGLAGNSALGLQSASVNSRTGQVTRDNRKGGKDTTGQYGRGNIDLNKRKVVHNKDGSISTERSFSVNIDGKETLLPTIINGKAVDEDAAIDHYYRTGEHLGRFDTVEEAEEYAEQLHNRQDWYYNQKNKNGGKSSGGSSGNGSKH